MTPLAPMQTIDDEFLGPVRSGIGRPRARWINRSVTHRPFDLFTGSGDGAKRFEREIDMNGECNIR